MCESFFFFQAEDGIRDSSVTGVQTCALPIYPRFLKRFTEYAKGVKVGDGLEKGITMGPLANARRLDAMDSIVADAKSRGGKIATGGGRRGNQGYFYEPTVITDVPDDSKIMTQEPFGP